MSRLALPRLPATPTIELDAAGPRGERGLLLRAPWHEALLWDLDTEIGSACRCWRGQGEALWIARGYLQTAVQLVLRSFPSVLLLGGAAGEDRLLSRDGVVAVQQRLI